MPEPRPPQEPDHPSSASERLFATEHLVRDLRGRSIRGGSVTLTAQACRFAIQMASTVVLARLLTPADFGLVAMVMAITGFVELFMDLGLSVATVQRETISHAQVTTLFWINVVVSAGLTALTAALAPVIAWAYGEPRLVPFAAALAVGFVLSGIGAQHQALLRRSMRFASLAVVDIAANFAGAALAIVAATFGLGAWSLVVQRLVTSLATSCGLWLASRWRPSWSFGWTDVRPMLALGGNLTGFNTVNYFARNADNMLIGRVWGPEQLGLYARAYQLLLLPIQQINVPLTSVALLGLSRLQGEPERFRSFYLQALALVVGVTMPLVVLMTVLSDEIVALVLGPQWEGAGLLFRLLASAVLVQPTCNTTGWLYVATGRTDRMFRWGLAYAALVLLSFIVGLPYGAAGVAGCYSGAMLLQTAPCLWFAVRGTRITLRDVATALAAPTISAFAAGAVALGLDRGPAAAFAPWARIAICGIAFAIFYAALLLGVFRKRDQYLRLLSELRKGSS